MKRVYQKVFLDHLESHRQMLFVMGPRQAGKTTVAQALVENSANGFYFNWDNIDDREVNFHNPHLSTINPLCDNQFTLRKRRSAWLLMMTPKES